VGVHHPERVGAVFAVDGHAEDAVIGQEIVGFLRQDVRGVFQGRDAVQPDAAPDDFGKVDAGVGDARFQDGSDVGVDDGEAVDLPAPIVRRRRVFVMARADPLAPAAAVKVEVLAGEFCKSVDGAALDIQVEEFEGFQDDVCLGFIVVEYRVFQGGEGISASVARGVP